MWQTRQTSCHGIVCAMHTRRVVIICDFLLVCHCKISSILYHFRVIWRWIILWHHWRSLKVVKIKVQVWTLAIAPLTWVRLVTSSALQSCKWQLIGMSQWCRSALCGHPLPALTDNCSADSRHTIAPISHTRPSPRSRSYYTFPIPLRVGGWVGLSTQ